MMRLPLKSKIANANPAAALRVSPTYRRDRRDEERVENYPAEAELYDANIGFKRRRTRQQRLRREGEDVGEDPGVWPQRRHEGPPQGQEEHEGDRRVDQVPQTEPQAAANLKVAGRQDSGSLFPSGKQLELQRHHNQQDRDDEDNDRHGSPHVAKDEALLVGFIHQNVG